MEKKITITGAALYNENMGCVALSYSILYCLNKIAKENNVNLKFIIPNSGKNIFSDDFIIIDKEQISFTTIISLKLDIRNIAKMIFTFNSFIKSFQMYNQSDLVFDLSAGDSFTDIYGKNRFFRRINREHKLARFFNKQFCLLPQTIGPFKDIEVSKKARKTIEYADIVFARDKQSFDYVKVNTKQKNVYEIIDLAFFMPYSKKIFSKDFLHVGLNVSSLLWHGGYTKNNQFALKVDYQELIRNIIFYFISQLDVKLHLIPHVVGNDYSIENDYAVCYNLSEEFNTDRIELSPLFLTPIVAKSYISGMDFFIGARMHSTIAAFSSGVPLFPMSYSRKFNGLFRDTLDYEYMGDMVNCEKEIIMEDIKEAFNKRAELKQIINQRMNTVVKEREELLVKKLSHILGIS